MPTLINSEDTPISILNEGEHELPFVIFDVHGTRRARFAQRDDAQAYGDAVNFPEPKLKQSDRRDSSVTRGKKAASKKKEKSMPRGIPKKKKAVVAKKRRSAKSSVKKAVKKTMKRRKKKSRFE